MNFLMFWTKVQLGYRANSHRSNRECFHMVLMNFYAACLPVGVWCVWGVCVCLFRSVICSCCFYWINDARVAADDAAGVAELEADSPFLPLCLCLSFSSLPSVFYTIRSTLLLLLFFEAHIPSTIDTWVVEVFASISWRRPWSYVYVMYLYIYTWMYVFLSIKNPLMQLFCLSYPRVSHSRVHLRIDVYIKDVYIFRISRLSWSSNAQRVQA